MKTADKLRKDPGFTLEKRGWRPSIRELLESQTSAGDANSPCEFFAVDYAVSPACGPQETSRPEQVRV